MPHGATRNTPPYSCLQVPAEKELHHSVLRSTLEWELMCIITCISMSSSKPDQPSWPALWPGSHQHLSHHL